MEANRVPVTRAIVLPDERHPPDQIAAYLPVIHGYDPAKLDLPCLVQLVRAYHQVDRNAEAAAVGRARLLSGLKGSDDESINALARLCGPLLRDRLNDPAGALAVWQAAGQAASGVSAQAENLLEAADVALHDLFQSGEAKKCLDAAEKCVKPGGGSLLMSRLERLRGDWHARNGEKDEALDAYRRATTVRASGRSVAEQEAWRSALSRSTEAFLRNKELDRALEELRRWRDEFPADAVEGYLPLLQARYWAAREQPEHVSVIAADLVALNPDSPYADQLVYLSADCAAQHGKPAQALAGFKALVTDYPGSPLVAEARKQMARIGTGSTPEKNKESR